MIYGLFLCPRSWKIDFQPSPFWNPDEFGVHIDLCNDAFRISEQKIDNKYTFVICSEVWEIPIRKSLQYLRNKGLKIFLSAREPIKYGELITAMFNYEKFNLNGQYYFKPDVVLSAGEKYAELWKDKTKTYITGYPRWDWYLRNDIKSKEKIRKQYGLSCKEIIFFSDFPPIHYSKLNGKDFMIDLSNERENILNVLLEYVKQYNKQLVLKVHPVLWKQYIKNISSLGPIVEKYYKNPTLYFKVIGDERMSGIVSKELLIVSDLVIGYNSTMLLEACILNKPIINVVFGKCNSLKGPYDNYFETAHDDFELINLLKNNKLKNKLEIKNLIKQYMGDVDGGCCKKMCEAIKNESQ